MKVQTSLTFFIVLVISILSYNLSLAVKHSDFKTCDQSGFCKRNREFAGKLSDGTTKSKYYVDKDSVVVEASKGTINARIYHSEDNKVDLTLDITTLANGRARVTINEKAPLKKRFDGLEELILNKPQSTSFEAKTKTEQGLKVEFDDGKTLHLEYNPFQISTENNGVPLVQLNKRGFFNFEYLRTKEDKKLHVQGEDKTVDLEDNTVDLEDSTNWQESFNGHTDSKPNGNFLVSV
jgi:alpha 1,3-glucosidase